MEISEKFLQTALDGVHDCINIVNRDFQIIFMNEAASKWTGKSRQMLLGSKCYAELWKESSPCESCVTGKVFSTGKPQQSIVWETRPGGEKVCIEKFSFPIVDNDGGVEYAVEIFRDITERKLLEEEREQQRLELGRRIRDIRHAYEELKSLQNQLLQAEKMASVGLMASSIAHELDTPLATISGYCELLAEDIRDEKLLGQIKTISEQIVKCQKTIRNLLDFSRKSDCKKKSCDIHHLIRNTLSLVEHRIKIHKINIQETFDDRVPPVLVDGNQIQQVILNLVNNAVDALPQGGNIFIETRMKPESRSLEIIFEDNGIGISEEDKKRIFTPFFTTKEQGKGTGLGLSICNNIISAHNGKIAVESRLGNGTRFIISLPV